MDGNQTYKLFGVDDRTSWSSLNYNESTYEFFDRSSWPICGLIRDWVDLHCPSFVDDKEFLSRFKSKSFKQHSSAAMELLLFEILKGMNFEVEKVPRGARNTPDFAITRSDGQKIFAECVLAASAMESENERRKKEGLLQWLEQIPDFPFFVGVDFRCISDESISKRELYIFLKRVEPTLSKSTGIVTMPYNAQGWDLQLTLFRKTNLDVKRTRGPEQSPVKTIDNFTPLMAALNEKKPAKYGIENDAYIICVGVDDLTANEEEFFSVLYGAQDQRRINLNWSSEGFFMRNGQPANTSVSAVLFCKNIKLTGLASCKMFLWHHPFARKPIASDNWKCTNIRYCATDGYLFPDVKDDEASVLKMIGFNEDQYIKFLDFDYRRAPAEE
jgi:hypothetical protein